MPPGLRHAVAERSLAFRGAARGSASFSDRGHKEFGRELSLLEMRRHPGGDFLGQYFFVGIQKH